MGRVSLEYSHSDGSTSAIIDNPKKWEPYVSIGAIITPRTSKSIGDGILLGTFFYIS